MIKIESFVKKKKLPVLPFLFNSVVDDIMCRAVEQCPVDVVDGSNTIRAFVGRYQVHRRISNVRPSSANLQHVVELVSKPVEAYGLRLLPDECEQMWVSVNLLFRENRRPIEVVDKFCYLDCILKQIKATR
ncbi:hypothetical protein RB195_012839 [Necator americanus]|uniref:Uncharacterized protein n=1 Tax=Necator americanus TaxID=51031 RepID=A0ABR1DSX8_NECAM